MASPLSSTVASVPGPVLPRGVVLYGGSGVQGTASLSCRPAGVETRVPSISAGPRLGQMLFPGYGLDPVSAQLARLSRYQQAAAAAAAAACLITAGNSPGHHQSSAGHLLSYLYARQQHQQLQHDHCHRSHAGDGYLFSSARRPPTHDEPKPNHSYIGIIAMAILGSKERKLVLSDIYQWILDNYPYFRRRGPGWRNSIRHNLSLNDCFIKAGRSANGKGHYWAVHPANVEDFERGDFRRRRAQRKVRRAMGLSVADDDDDSPVPSPSTSAVWTQFRRPDDGSEQLELRPSTDQPATVPLLPASSLRHPAAVTRKRLFDVESLLAPDADKPEVVDAPEVDSTADPLRLRRRDDAFSVQPPDRKRRAVSPEVDGNDVIVDLHQPIRVADGSLTATSGDVMTSPDRKSADSDETGSGFASTTRRCADVQTTSGESTHGKSDDVDVTRFWLRHANMASTTLANSLFPFPATAYHVTCSNADAERPRDIMQGRGVGQGQGQGRDHGQCYREGKSGSHSHDCDKGYGQGHAHIRGQGYGQVYEQSRGQGYEEGQFVGQDVTDFKGLSLVREKHCVTPVNVN